MGKLGGEELNFSSDIDLLYLYSSDDGETTGVRGDKGEIVGRVIGDDLDGFMTYQELRRHTKGAITWPRKKPRERCD